MSPSRWNRWPIPQSAPRARSAGLRADCEPCEPRTLLSVAINNVTIDQPPAPQVASADFTVTLDAPSSDTVTVDYATRDGTAKAGVDYTPVQGTLTFAPGETAETIHIPVLSNPAGAPSPAFYVALSNSTNDTLSSTAATGAGLILANPANVSTAPPTATTSTPAPTSDTAAPADTSSSTPTTTPNTSRPADTSSSAPSTSASAPTTDASAPSAPPSAPTPPPPPSQPAPSAPATPPSANASTSSTGAPATSSQAPAPSTLGAPAPAGTVSAPTTAAPAPAAAVPTTSSSTDNRQPTTDNASPLVVTNTNDTGPGSLRSALQSALSSPGAPVITFAVPGTGPVVIRPQSPLPAITHPLTIDGTTQPGYEGTPVVTIDGTSAGKRANGLVVTGGHTTIEGLAIVRFAASGVVLQGGGGNTLSSDDLGTDAAGHSGLGNGADGVRIDASAHNSIGGSTIAGNSQVGVRITGPAATGNLVAGNRIGTTPDGVSALSNRADGVFIDDSAGNTIGGTLPAERNVISGNGSVGVQLDGPAATANQVLGNAIGTDAAGTHALGNGHDGVFLDNAPGNSIGGTGTGAGNIIAANGQVGLQLFGPGARGNVVQGNRIGQVAPGDAPGNAVGLYLNHAAQNTLGGPGAAANVVAGNTRADQTGAAVPPTPGGRLNRTLRAHRSGHGAGVRLDSLNVSRLLGTATKAAEQPATQVTSQALSLIKRLSNQSQGTGS